MRRINYKTLAAAMIAIQIAVTAMPASALACENDRIQETAQEQVEVNEEISEEVAGEAYDVTEDEAQNETAEQETEKQAQEQTAVVENQEGTKTSENPEQGKAFEQTVTVDGVRIRVSAEEGAFEDGARLSVVRVPSKDLKEVENAVADARTKDELVTSAYAFDIKILGQDGSVLQPAGGKKIKVSFETKEAADGSLGAVVYHLVNTNNNITAKKLATTINRDAKTAEAQTDGLSYYVVEFVSKARTDENTEANTGANTNAKTGTNEDTEKPKTEDVIEDKTTKEETPAEKDAAKSNTENDTVKKETKTETKTENNTSEVKKEKKTETEKKTSVTEKKSENNKKKETEKKENTDSKKTDKSKTNGKKSPKTGDTANMMIWLTMGVLAAGGIIVLLVFRRRLS